MRYGFMRAAMSPMSSAHARGIRFRECYGYSCMLYYVMLCCKRAPPPPPADLPAPVSRETRPHLAPLGPGAAPRLRLRA